MESWEETQKRYQLKRMLDNVASWINSLIIVLIGFILMIAICVSLYVGCRCIQYKVNKTNCNLYIDNELVYTGRSALVHVYSIGENGNTKQVIIHKNKFGLVTDKVYVNDNVRLETIGN